MSLGLSLSRLSRSSTARTIPWAAQSALTATSIIITSGGVPATTMLVSLA